MSKFMEHVLCGCGRGTAQKMGAGPQQGVVVLLLLLLCLSLCLRIGMGDVCDGVPIAKNLKRISHPQSLIGIGAAKSGTSFLFNALQSHPKISKGTSKEMAAFTHKYKPTQEYYDRYIQSWGTKEELETGNQSQVLLEITPSYLQTYEVPCRIKNFVPDAKFLVTLRHPVDRTMSHINMKRKLCIHNPKRRKKQLQGCCSNEFYSTALRIAASIENMRTDAQQCLNVSSPDPWRDCSAKNITPMHTNLYGTQLAHWFKIFDPSQFVFINANELFEDPVTQVNRVLKFLGMSTDWDLDQYVDIIFKRQSSTYFVDPDVHVIRNLLRDGLEEPLQDFYRVLEEHGIKFSPLQMSTSHHSNVTQISIEAARRICWERRFPKLKESSDALFLPLSELPTYGPALPMLEPVSSVLNQPSLTVSEVRTVPSIQGFLPAFMLFAAIAFMIWQLRKKVGPISVRVDN